jgi:AraC-like DNA-binding protein
MSPDIIPSRQADLFTLTEMIDVVRRFAGSDWRPEEVSTQSAGHEGLERVEALSEARIACGRPATSITLPRSFLPRSLIISGTPAPHPSAGASESDPWLASAPPPGFTDSVRALVRSLLPLGSLEVEIAAEGARMSVRSLQRRLTEEGTSFSRILDDVRFAAARGMLEGSDLKLIEIALELGYSDPAHFTRAFRRWTSVTPGMYRRMVPDAVRERRSA